MKDNFQHIRLIVCDLDGTLLHDDKTLDDDIKQCIHDLKGLGIRFTLASGRNIHIMKNYMSDLQIELPCITNNGANMYVHDQCIYERDMEHDELLYALQTLNQHALPFIAYTADAVYIKDASCVALQGFLQRLKGKTKIVDGFDVNRGIPSAIFKVVIIPYDQICMQKAYTAIHDGCDNLQCVRSEDDVFTMTHIAATKGKTLLALLKQEAIAAQEVMVFGDNFNDISMFEAAGLSVAMENAHEEVKAQASFITHSNNKNGVSLFLKEHLLNKPK